MTQEPQESTGMSGGRELGWRKAQQWGNRLAGGSKTGLGTSLARTQRRAWSPTDLGKCLLNESINQ